MKKNIVIFCLCLTSILFSQNSTNTESEKKGFFTTFGRFFSLEGGYAQNYVQQSIKYSPKIFTDFDYEFNQSSYHFSVSTPIFNYGKKGDFSKFTNKEDATEFETTDINMWGLFNILEYFQRKNNREYGFLGMLIAISPLVSTTTVEMEDYTFESKKKGALFGLFLQETQKEKMINEDITVYGDNMTELIFEGDLLVEKTRTGISLQEAHKNIVKFYTFIAQRDVSHIHKIKKAISTWPLPTCNIYYDQTKFTYSNDVSTEVLELETQIWELGVNWMPVFYFPRKKPKFVFIGDISYLPFCETIFTLGGNNWSHDFTQKSEILSFNISIFYNF
jgi:hypothetical protein